MDIQKQISIIPTTVTNTVTISNISVEIVTLVLNSFVQVRVLQCTSNGDLHKVDYITIEGDDYKKWGSDDSYILTFVLNKLGYTKSNIVVNA